MSRAPVWWSASRRARDDDRGTALIEFATVLPVLLILYAGGVQASDWINCSRKVTITTRSVADLVSQNTTGTITANEIDSNLAAATQVMVPYPASKALVRVTEITTDSTGKSTVVWSRAINGSRYTAGSVVTIPAAMRISGSYFIFSETQYSYKPFVTFNITAPQVIKDSIYMLPRNTSDIACSDC